MKVNALLLFLLVALAVQIQAQATLSVQGTLQKSFGAAVDDGTYSLTFKLYESLTGGIPVWKDSLNNVQVTGGVYSVVLGAGTPLTASFNKTYYLGVAVGSGMELIPRARLTSAPYALALIGQSNAFPSLGGVGIGTTTPATDLHIKDSIGDAELHIESPYNVARLSMKDADQTGELLLSDNALTLQAHEMPLRLSGETVSLHPSSGKVGIGTTTPATDLHIKDNSGQASLTLQSPSDARISLQDSDQQAELGVFLNGLHLLGGDNLPLILGGNVIYLRHNNTPMLDFSAVGTNPYIKAASGMTHLNLGLASKGDIISIWEGAHNFFNPNTGSANPRNVNIDAKVWVSGPLRVDGFHEITEPYHTSYSPLGVSGPHNQSGATNHVGINCAQAVHASLFRAVSDRRIKKNFRLSDGAEDLAALRRLRITDYQYVDEVMKGSSFHKGLVAQEVMEIMPAAVGTTSDFVPDIYLPAASIIWKDGQLTLHTSREHQLQAGDQVRLILKEGAKEFTVAASPDARSFAVSWTEAAPEWVFVYGKKVEDFQQVDYDQVHNLAISAIQELARRLEQLEQENAALRMKNATLQGQNDGLRSDVNGMNERLLKLENLMTGNAQR